MSMLAEQKRRTKWVINPTKKPIWSTDSSGIKFGKQLMEKMGWSAGKGLGVNEQGIHEPLKVSFKNDTKGMGFKGNDDDWIEHQDEFNILLNQLRNNADSSALRHSDAEKNEIKSLEKKSKQSKARVHYQKFTRGKDLSRYSEKDLACILGTSKTRKKETPKNEVVETDTKINGNYETSFGVTTINSGSIHDYFKKKWKHDEVRSGGLDGTVDDKEEENFQSRFVTGISNFPGIDEFNMKAQGEEQQYIKKKHKSKSEKELLVTEENKTAEIDKVVHIPKLEKLRKKKRESEISEEEPGSKKKKKNSDNNSCLVNESPHNESLGNDCSNKEKREKDKNYAKSEVLNGEESKNEKEFRKRNVTVCINGSVVSAEEMNSTHNASSILQAPIKKKNKKKEKKGRSEEHEYINRNQIDSSGGDFDKSCLETQPIKSKKKRALLEDDNADNLKTLDGDNPKESNLEKVETGINGVCQNEKTKLVESGKKKKKKKEKKESESTKHELCCNKLLPSEAIKDCEISLGLELQKKKRKAKKGKYNEETQNGEKIKESCMYETSCKEIHFNIDAEGGLEPFKKRRKKENKEKLVEIDNNEKEKTSEESTLDADHVKKKKKKHKKQKSENEDEKSFQLSEVEELSVMITKKESKEDNTAEKEIELNGVLNMNAEKGRLQKLTVNLFPDKAADKYFPGQGTNERVLKLIRWANISQFKGSNLCDVEGYGRRKFYEKQFR